MNLIEKLTKAMDATDLKVEPIKVKAGERVTATCDSLLMPAAAMMLIAVQTEYHFDLISSLFAISKELAAELNAPKEIRDEWLGMLNKLEDASKSFAEVKADIAKYTE